ncbi:hypothetical protein [Streptomyces sp. NPDC018711]
MVLVLVLVLVLVRCGCCGLVLGVGGFLPAVESVYEQADEHQDQ